MILQQGVNVIDQEIGAVLEVHVSHHFLYGSLFTAEIKNFKLVRILYATCTHLVRYLYGFKDRCSVCNVFRFWLLFELHLEGTACFRQNKFDLLSVLKRFLHLLDTRTPCLNKFQIFENWCKNAIPDFRASGSQLLNGHGVR